MSSGRFAPSPSGDLHLGNLRTALLAWLCARRTGRDFVIRVEDLDRVREGAEQRQLADLAAIGLDWDGPIIRQSERARYYDAALASLAGRGLVYECYCSRREIREAASAPHSPPGSYPGTCRDLTDAEREAAAAANVRRRCGCAPRRRPSRVEDALHGRYEGVVDDFALRRGDGAVAYNLAVVVDDAQQRHRPGGARRRPAVAPLLARPISPPCWARPRPATSTSRWRSTPQASGSPSGTAP